MKPVLRSTLHSAQRGVALIDGLAGLAVLSFGVLGIGSMQARLLDAGLETQSRLAAVRQADELVSLALVDPAQGACYEVPVRSGNACEDANARAAAAAWRERATAALPAPADAQALYDGTQLVVTLRWTGKRRDAHQLTAVTDVRP